MLSGRGHPGEALSERLSERGSQERLPGRAFPGEDLKVSHPGKTIHLRERVRERSPGRSSQGVASRERPCRRGGSLGYQGVQGLTRMTHTPPEASPLLQGCRDVRPPSGQVECYGAPGLLEEQYCLSVGQALEHSTVDRENLITLAQVRTGKIFHDTLHYMFN